ncbi:hypothetical protein, partial [Desulfovibrio piger]|uniref:hypothetical protein n=1 Tax=Desulfovibrio piger TaxID=901 RepID=UPI0026EFD2AC
ATEFPALFCCHLHRYDVLAGRNTCLVLTNISEPDKFLALQYLRCTGSFPHKVKDILHDHKNRCGCSAAERQR